MQEGMFETEFGEAQSMESTSQQTAQNYGWVSYREDRSMRPKNRVWMFTDGSTSGWCAAALVHPGVKVLPLAMRHVKAQMANVQAELNAFLLGLEHATPDATLIVVSDYIGIGGWMTGAWQIKHPAVEKAIERAHEIAKEKRLLQGMSFIHHGGHQDDDSDLTVWNTVVDRMCCDVPLLPTGKVLAWADVQVSKAHLNNIDKAARSAAALHAGNNSRQSHWTVIAKPKADVEYLWVDTGKGTTGRCMLSSAGVWAEAPAPGSVVLLHTPPASRARDDGQRAGQPRASAGS